MNSQSATVTLNVFDIKLTIGTRVLGYAGQSRGVMTWVAGRGILNAAFRHGYALVCGGDYHDPCGSGPCFCTPKRKRAWGAMDEIVLGKHMPHTLYYDNDVPPTAHRARALVVRFTAPQRWPPIWLSRQVTRTMCSSRLAGLVGRSQCDDPGWQSAAATVCRRRLDPEVVVGRARSHRGGG